MENKIILVNPEMTKEEIIERYESYIENLVNPMLGLFETSTSLSEKLGIHVVEWNRMLSKIGVLDEVYRVGKKGNKNINLIGWKLNKEHKKYLLANGLAIEVYQTRDAVYWNQTKTTHILLYINNLLRKNDMPLLKLNTK